MAKKPKKPNWEKIATEYITGDIGQVKLAEKHGVPLRTLQDRCKAEGWVAQKKAHRGATVAKACEIISEQQAGQMAELVTRAASELLAKAMTAIGQLDKPITSHKHTIEIGEEKSTEEWEEISDKPGAVNVAGVRHLATALKDIAGVLGLETELDRQEKEARIAALRARVPAGDDEGGVRHGVVLLPQVEPPTPPEEDSDG